MTCTSWKTNIQEVVFIMSYSLLEDSSRNVMWDTIHVLILLLPTISYSNDMRRENVRFIQEVSLK